MWKYNGNPIGSVLPPTVRDGDFNRPSRLYQTDGEWDYDALAALGYAWEDDPEPAATGDRASEIMNRLLEIDAESVRPLRAEAAGAETQDDLDRLTALEAEAQALRLELATLEGS